MYTIAYTVRIMYIMLNSAMSSLAVRPVARVSYTHKQGLLWAPWKQLCQRCAATNRLVLRGPGGALSIAPKGAAVIPAAVKP
jgi:hypothetical protein